MANLNFDLAGKRVWVAGHRGMVGSAITRRLQSEDCEIITADRSSLDLTRQADVEKWMSFNKPEVVFLAAAKVGGILWRLAMTFAGISLAMLGILATWSFWMKPMVTPNKMRKRGS